MPLNTDTCIGNYDISKMHYDGPGDVPGAPGHGYGYDIRVAGLSSTNPPPTTEVAAAA
jgi:20S proteasome subunit beta 5